MNISKAIEASLKFQELMEGILPTIILGPNLFIESSKNPNITSTKEKSIHILNGILIVHLFSMWDTYFENNAIDRYFRPEEKQKFYAFKHLRIIAAHNIEGTRKSNRENKKRMDHADKLDEIMNSEQAFQGVTIKYYKVNLGKSNVALDCRQFMQDMAFRLASGRISVGAPYGKIRSQNGTATEIL